MEKEENRAYETDMNNWNLGQYLRIAFNDANHYPKKPYLEDKRKSKKKAGQKVMTPDEMERNMMFNTKILGGTINEG